jgi:hypothetical protein
VAPADVSVGTLGAFEAYLVARTLTTRPSKRAGEVRSGWNEACARVEPWVGQPIGARSRPKQYTLPLEAFPETFQADLAAFGQRMGATSLDALDEPGSEDDGPLTRAAALRSLHRGAAPEPCPLGSERLGGERGAVDDVTSLASLVTPPERAKAAIRYLYNRAGQQPSAAGTHVAEVLRIIAKHHVGLPPPQVARIKAWSTPVALNYRGMTERNERCVRAMMQPERLERLLQLPEALMRAARQLRTASPAQARSLALRAVAIGILIKLPIRLANLAGLRLDRHFHRPDPGRGHISHLLIPKAT